MPTGTIYLTTFDDLSRPMEKSVGTNLDNITPTTDYFYDGGTGKLDAVGDSDMTRLVQHPAGDDTTVGDDQPDRVDLMYYDWRNRRMAIKLGASDDEGDDVHRLIQFTDYDNQNEPIASYTYAGDGTDVSVSGDDYTVALTDDGVATKPSSGLLRAKSTTTYDNQGRVITETTFGDLDSVAFGDSIATNYFYDHRGNLVDVAAPGGLSTKTVYDGADRPTIVYQTDGYSDSTTWSNAISVADDHVLTQTETKYDDDGNAVFWIKRDRFHDADFDTSDDGPLGDPSSTTGTAKARVYYSEAFYDAADRLTNFVDVGTNGGSAYTRDTVLPSRSDDTLITSYDYNEAGWNDIVTDPRDIQTRYTYDNAGRVTKTIENYVNGVMETSDSTEDDDRTTEYTYDGDDHVTSMKADQVSGYEETKWVYGDPTLSVSSLTRSLHTVTVTTSTAHDYQVGELVEIKGADQTDYDGVFQVTSVSGSTFTYTRFTSETATATGTITVSRPDGVKSNDVLSAIRYPDLSSGDASVSSEETFDVDALGETTSYTDRNGTRHDYSYDPFRIQPRARLRFHQLRQLVMQRER